MSKTKRTIAVFAVVFAAAVASPFTEARAATTLYTAEGDIGSATDIFDSDGAQNGTFSGNVAVSSANPKFGSNAYQFTTDSNAGEPRIEVQGTSGTSLGSAFSIGAWIDPSNETDFQRLFQVYDGVGSATATELLVGVDPDGSVVNGFRAIINGTQVTASSAQDLTGGYHQVVVTYNNGAVVLYVDGAQVGSGTAGSGSVNLEHNIYIGSSGGSSNQFFGDVDDFFLLDYAASSDDVLAHFNQGSLAFIPEPSTFVLFGLGGLTLGRFRRGYRS